MMFLQTLTRPSLLMQGRGRGTWVPPCTRLVTPHPRSAHLPPSIGMLTQDLSSAPHATAHLVRPRRILLLKKKSIDRGVIPNQTRKCKEFLNVLFIQKVVVMGGKVTSVWLMIFWRQQPLFRKETLHFCFDLPVFLVIGISSITITQMENSYKSIKYKRNGRTYLDNITSNNRNGSP